MATAVIDLAAARRAVDMEAVRKNSKIVDQIPGMIAKASEDNRLYIFNVGFKPHERRLSYKNFYVPACEPEKRCRSR